jgi:hypothetical protein
MVKTKEKKDSNTLRRRDEVVPLNLNSDLSTNGSAKGDIKTPHDVPLKI